MIRKAMKKDADAIKLIATLAWQQAYCELVPDSVQKQFMDTAYSMESIEARIKEGEVVVATKDNLIVGFSHYGFHGDHTHLYAIYVLPNHQKEGVGTELLNYVEKASKKYGALVVLELENGNRIGESFYRRKGFNEVEYRADALFGHPLKTIVMKKSVE